MIPEHARFIDASTLLFIASRDGAGALDVSPRGGQPAVLRRLEDGRLLLPDYPGNRRLDTIGNVLHDPAVVLLILNRGADRVLRVRARAEVTREAELMALFPADENPPLSLMVFHPTRAEMLESTAFAAAGFWIAPAERKPPLDLGAIYARDRAWQEKRSGAPVPRDASGEAVLREAGLRGHYGTPSAAVQTKVYRAAGPAFMSFIDAACFIVLARAAPGEEIALDILGGVTLGRDPGANADAFRLALRPDQLDPEGAAATGQSAMIAVEPGRNETVRLNGRYRGGPPDAEGRPQIVVGAEEIYFHCSAALARSRVWSASPPVLWAGRRRFVCTARRRESPDVVSFELAPDDAAPLGPVSPGQYVTVTLAGEEGRPPRPGRSYSVSRRVAGRSLRVTVRRIGNGGISALLHDDLQVGTAALVGLPSGGFVLDSAPGRPVVLVSAGVGITPLMPMLETLADERQDEEGQGREVWFVHAARDPAHHLFPDEARRIAGASGGRIRLFSAYSRGQEGEGDHRGRLNAQVLAGLTDVAAADFYVCGPEAFMEDLRTGLVALGAAPDAIRIEAFQPVSAGFGPLGSGATGPFRVTFTRSGCSATWTPESGSLLDLALASGIDAPYSCRNGDCLSCMQRLVRGEVDYPQSDVPFLAYGQVLLCTAIPTGDVEIDC